MRMLSGNTRMCLQRMKFSAIKKKEESMINVEKNVLMSLREVGALAIYLIFLEVDLDVNNRGKEQALV